MTEDKALPALVELINARLFVESVQRGVVFTNDMLRDVVYTEAGDARLRLFHQRMLEFLEAAGVYKAVLAPSFSGRWA